MKKLIIILLSLFTINSIAYEGISLVGNENQVKRLKSLLKEIEQIPFGRETLKAIATSGNKVRIIHNTKYRSMANVTLAPLSSRLFNGTGDSVEIHFDTTIPDKGTHFTYDFQTGKIIEFTAVQNLFHELSHARHMLNGTWNSRASERQAIDDENIFRGEQQSKLGIPTHLHELRDDYLSCEYGADIELCHEYFED